MNEEEWERIDLMEIVYYFGERDIVCVHENEFYCLDKEDEVPKTLKLEWVLFGEWYVRKKKPSSDVSGK